MQRKPREELISDVWRRNAAETPEREAIVHCADGRPAKRWSWRELMERAAQLTSVLLDSGVESGNVCAIIMRHHPDFYPLYIAVEEIGAIPAVLAYPNPRLHPDKFRDGLRGMSRVSGLDWILTEGELRGTIEPLVSEPGSTVHGLLFPLDSDSASGSARLPARYSAAAPGDPCLLQHSSGTTGLQKGVMLSHRAVLTHVANYAEAIELTSEDRIISWLPLYHDMGLIAAFHLPLAMNVPLVVIDPFEWVAEPALLIQLASEESATISWLPNFAYSLMAARIRDDDLDGVSLDRIRLLVNCSEPVRGESHDAFAERFAAAGFRRSALGASYAMAEATFAVTQTPPGEEAKRIRASRSAFANGQYLPAKNGEADRLCVSSGRPIKGCEIRIVGAGGEEAPEATIGEIFIRSDSLFSGYRNNPEATGHALKDGWYASGDYGFLLDGECYVVGRKKDVIIVAGKNIYPEDIESVVNDVDGIIPGRVIALGLEDAASGTERICVVAETSQSESVHPSIRQAVIAAAMLIDVTVSEVLLAEPRWLIKSSAGKPSRSGNKARVEQLLTDGGKR